MRVFVKSEEKEMRKNKKEESYYFSQVSQTFSEVSNQVTEAGIDLPLKR